MSEEYISEFQAPNYTILRRRDQDTEVVTTVIIDGEIAEFVAGRTMVEAGARLAIQQAGEAK